jgi:hypothetical protein
MHFRSLRGLAMLSLFLCFTGAPPTRGQDEYRVSGPITHENLTVYFLRGASNSGPVPLTLAEALAAKSVRVLETGSVNELTIENLGDREVFVQSGDIVKGGRQDRVLAVSLILSPHSGVLPITAFCVEQGRWSKRGYEDMRQFNSAAASLPSRTGRLAIQSLDTGLMGALGSVYRSPGLSSQQSRVWNDVASVQRSLSETLSEPVASPQSPTSLQLALENQKLRKVQDGYIAALKPTGDGDTDIVGYAFAINGKLDSADVYPSNALFRKMWDKLLTANVTEAIAAKSASSTNAPPSAAEVGAFLKAAEGGPASKQKLTGSVDLEIHKNNNFIYLETLRPSGSWAYRSYIAQ